MSDLENFQNMSTYSRWIYAFKVMSWPKLIVPFLLGQSFGIYKSSGNVFLPFVLGIAFTIFLLLYIVLLNDYADQKVDALKRKMFPNGCSPKTIPDHILPARSVLFAGVLASVLCLISASLSELILGRPYVVLFAIICILVFAAYSLPPIKLNYRGGGEFLEMMGVGCMLPIFHYYLQLGFEITFDAPFLAIVVISTIFALASAMASGLSDEESDRAGGKQTFVTEFGNKNVKMWINSLTFIAVILIDGYLIFVQRIVPLTLSLVLILFLLYQIRFLFKLSPLAKTNVFDMQRNYKDYLHRIIWGSMTLVSLSFLVSKYVASEFFL